MKLQALFYIYALKTLRFVLYALYMKHEGNRFYNEEAARDLMGELRHLEERFRDDSGE